MQHFVTTVYVFLVSAAANVLITLILYIYIYILVTRTVSSRNSVHRRSNGDELKPLQVSSTRDHNGQGSRRQKKMYDVREGPRNRSLTAGRLTRKETGKGEPHVVKTFRENRVNHSANRERGCESRTREDPREKAMVIGGRSLAVISVVA